MALLTPKPAASVALAIALAAPSVHARNRGIPADGCTGCHHGGATPEVTIDFSPRNPAPGATVSLEVTIQAVNGGVGGLFLRTDGRGRLAAVDGQGAHLLNDAQLVHTAPKRADDGAVRFEARWIAPETPGGVELHVFALSGNGDGRSQGDGGASAVISFAYGCEGITYYRDHDEDGYGHAGSPTVDCSQPPRYAARGDDCDDNSPGVHPGHEELCNGIDDDCDGEADENLEERTHYEDADGDGHGSWRGETVVAKCPPRGFAASADDCDDNNPLIHAGAEETCNYFDDDCDGDVDERAREVCGVGMCARASASCAPGLCEPGEPGVEVCNALDDDCDGDVDEGDDLCASETVCRSGECVAGDVDAAEERGAGGGCAIDPEGGSPWGLLALLSTRSAGWMRRRRRAAR